MLGCSFTFTNTYKSPGGPLHHTRKQEHHWLRCTVQRSTLQEEGTRHTAAGEVHVLYPLSLAVLIVQNTAREGNTVQYEDIRCKREGAFGLCLTLGALRPRLLGPSELQHCKVRYSTVQYSTVRLHDVQVGGGWPVPHPRSPASPSPRTLSALPEATPAGMLRGTCLRTRSLPSPLHRLQKSVITSPLPEHVAHVDTCARKKPRPQYSFSEHVLFR